MTEQNGRLMKSFSQLEKLLNDMYGRQEGKGSVTVYIDLMKEKQQTDRDVYDVDDWEEDLRSLKNIRYKRNKIAHESDAMDADMCERRRRFVAGKFSGTCDARHGSAGTAYPNERATANL